MLSQPCDIIVSGSRELTATTGTRTLSPKKPTEQTMIVRLTRIMPREAKSRMMRKVMVSYSQRIAP